MTVNSLPVRTDTPARTPAPKVPHGGRRMLLRVRAAGLNRGEFIAGPEIAHFV